MNTVGNDTNIAVQGPNHSLHFYWAINGIAGWHPEKVAGAGTTYSAPSMLDSDSEVIIAVQGPNHSLVLYWAANGVAGWNRVQAAGPGTTYSAPSMTTATTAVSDFLFVTAEGPGHSLHLYWQFFDGGLGPSFPGFNDELVAPAGTTYSAPSILAASGDVLISAQGASHSLILYWQPIHGTGWSPEQLGNPASIYSATSMTTASGSYVFISAEGPSHQPYWYAVRPGSFGWNFLGGGIPAIGATAYAAPSITATSDGVLIAAEAASHRLQFWSSTDSGNTWN